MRQAIVLHLATLPALLSGIACSPVHPQVHADFIEELKHGVTVTVFPAVVRQGTRIRYDVDASERIAAHLRRSGVSAETARAEVPVGDWHVNEARMVRASASALADYVTGHGLTTRYALALEFLIGPNDHVLAIHLSVVRADGEIAALSALNSQHPLFQSLKPTTPDACTSLAIAAIDEKWVTP